MAAEAQTDNANSPSGVATALKSLKTNAPIPKFGSGWRIAAVLGLVAVVLLAAGYLSWRSFRLASPPKSEKIMLAVLPFQNLTGDPNKEYLADGLTAQMISQLVQLH